MTTDPAENAVLQPFQLGTRTLKNRTVMPPLTRSRATDDGLATDLMAEYYEQRAGAGLIIVEGTQISVEGQGFPWTPGIYTDAQVEAWRKVVDRVHAAGGTIYLQLWHVGRQTHSSIHGGINRGIAPSAIAASGKIFTNAGTLQDFEVPRALEAHEIPGIVEQYARGARNAIAAGFDGVEVHAASGYLIDQFINTSSNTRTDEYGGTPENRLRFLFEVVDAVTAAVGADRTGVRLSPSMSYGDMFSDDKLEVYSLAVSELNKHGLAYLHLVEPNVSGSELVEGDDGIPSAHFRTLFDGPLIVSGNHTPETADETIRSGTADLVGFGKLYIANPDLPERIRRGAPLLQAERATYYGGGAPGYTDYPTLED